MSSLSMVTLGRDHYLIQTKVGEWVLLSTLRAEGPETTRALLEVPSLKGKCEHSSPLALQGSLLSVSVKRQFHGLQG